MSLGVPSQILMDMGGGAPGKGPSCKISMLWNWTVIDSCFLASSWHVRTKGQFAGSCLGVFFLCAAIELVRRLGRDYDRRLVASAAARTVSVEDGSNGSGSPNKGVSGVSGVPLLSGPGAGAFAPNWFQQVFRSVIYGSQFTAAFLVMLLGMYYNGYILISLFLGQTFGYFLFGRDTVGAAEGVHSGCCC
ncbi:Copper transport protein CTR4 [Vanrija pseudolonga]|uniref:Copper transport protein n=1 Tax=Vanrija pseudolonga TaxID=143232 RepID=A0AAF0YF98_9TREE|nr:Copper transport protein CTR4 [Vanrija pseudolonga]